MSTFEPGPTGDALRDLRQLSPYPTDEGELIGKSTPRTCLCRFFFPATIGKPIR